MKPMALFPIFLLFPTLHHGAASTPWPEPMAPAPFSVLQDASRAKWTLADARAELAAARLLLEVDRRHAEALRRLGALAEWLASRQEPEAQGLRETVAALEREARRALGEDVSASPDRIDEAVASAIRVGDFDFVRALGKRSVPALRLVITQAPEAFSGAVEDDPLFVLRAIDPLAFSETVGELLGRGGLFWRKRVARLLEDQVLGSKALWGPGKPDRWLGVGLSDAAMAWVDDPDVGEAAFSFLSRLFERVPRTERFDEILRRALRSPDARRREQARRVVQLSAYDVPSELLVELLAEPDPSLRSFGIEALKQRFPGNPALFRLVGDPEAEVRASVAGGLSSVLLDTPEGRAALQRLLSDPQTDVRQAALEKLRRLPERTVTLELDPDPGFRPARLQLSRVVTVAPLPDESYRKLAAEGAGPALVPIAVRLPSPLCFEICETLARSSDPKVASDLAAAQSPLPYWENPEATLRVLLALHDRPGAGESIGNTVEALTALRNTREGTLVLARALLARPENELLFVLHRRSPFTAQVVRCLPAPLAVDLVERLDSQAISPIRDFFALSGPVFDPDPEFARACAGLAREASKPLYLRLAALFGLLRFGDPEGDLEALAGAILVDPAWVSVSEGDEYGLVYELARRDLGPTSNALLLRVLREPRAPEKLANLLVRGLRPELAGAEEAVRLLLERGYGRAGWEEAVGRALWAMGTNPALADRAWLARAARDPDRSRAALGAIGKIRDPRDLGLLAELVEQPLAAPHLAQVAEALFGYLDAEAAQPLLTAAARVQDPEVRDRCLAHLEKIREYQEARERWATRRVRAQTREEVLAQLVAQLDAKSDEIRVQAIRALATWEAVEVMPRLIELSASGSKAVSAAAKAALEQLNARKGE